MALGRWMLLWREMSTLAIGEGYRATEAELLARDVAARRAALDELLGAAAGVGRVGPRLRRLSMRYGLDPDAAFDWSRSSPGLTPTRRRTTRGSTTRTSTSWRSASTI